MGFFKWAAAAAGVVGSVMLAPIVLPAAAAVAAAGAATAAAGAAAVTGAAAAGAAAVTGAAAAGAAAVTGAAAAGAAAVTGAAAAGATAVAGTAVGGTIVGAASTVATVGTGVAATVGGVVGGAAEAVGLTTIAAATGTTAGAAGVGTIATSLGVGGVAGVGAKLKFDEAEDIYDSAKQNYASAKSEYDNTLNSAKKSMEKLAEAKKVAAKSLEDFNEVFRKIQNPSEFGTIVVGGDYCKGVDTKVDLKAYPITLENLSKSVLKSFAGGDIAGVALTSGITSTITTAGTGTAMASLSGAAATNATMAALGGGTVASGGLGMAGGAIIAKGLVFAPALAIGGIMMYGKGSEAIKKAEETYVKANQTIDKMKTSGQYLAKLDVCMGVMSNNIYVTHSKFEKVWDIIRPIVYDKNHINASIMNKHEKMAFFAGIGLSKVMEIQLKKNFIKDNSNPDKLSVVDVVPKEEIEKCIYSNDGIVAFTNIPNTSLNNVINEVLKNT